MNDKEVVQLSGKVFIYYSNKGLVLRLPTKIEWKDRNNEENKPTIENLVKKLRGIISAYMAENGCKPSRDFVKGKLKEEIPSPSLLLKDVLDHFLQSKKKEVEDGIMKPGSLTDFSSFKGAMTDFETNSETTFQISDITDDFISRFLNYLKTERNLSEDSCKKRLRTLKSFLTFCEDKRGFKFTIDIK